MSSFATSLIEWQKKHGRHHLPWQKDKTAYRVWVSEIMLQQTQVETVIPYYETFMQRFPDCKSLACADISEVLTLWAGLGYYRRAHNLHKASIIVTEQHGGNFPSDVANLEALPGIGRSTAHAIASIVFKKPYAILDGNVKRILARYFAIEEPINTTACEKKLWDIAQTLMPTDNCQIYTQAVMDLGAQVCMRSPMCHLCPVSDNCLAKKRQKTQCLPIKKPKKAKRKLHYLCLLYIHNNSLWLEKRSEQSIWPSLWCPPMPESENSETLKDKHHTLATITHSLTHIDMHITPCVIYGIPVQKDGKWVTSTTVKDVGLPSAIKKILARDALLE